jgi:hypothetical protein
MMSPSSSSHFTTTSYGRIVETAYLLGIHHWEHEMLEEAGGEFMGLYVRYPGVDHSMTPLTHLSPDPAQPTPANVAGNGA